jgi:hypothetical protein
MIHTFPSPRSTETKSTAPKRSEKTITREQIKTYNLNGDDLKRIAMRGCEQQSEIQRDRSESSKNNTTSKTQSTTCVQTHRGRFRRTIRFRSCGRACTCRRRCVPCWRLNDSDLSLSLSLRLARVLDFGSKKKKKKKRNWRIRNWKVRTERLGFIAERN